MCDFICKDLRALLHFTRLVIFSVIIFIIIIIIIIDAPYHRSFLPGTSLEPAVNPTAQASSFTLLHTAVLFVLCVMFQV
jgi:hypothetical protein